MTGTDILTALGGIGVILAAVAWLVRSIILHFLSKDIESYKTKLQLISQEQTIRLEDALETAAFEHQVRFSRLHEKRAEVIGELYAKLAHLHSAVTSFLFPVQLGSEPSQEVKSNQIVLLADEFSDYFDTHRIYFSKDLCGKLISFNASLAEAHNKLARGNDDDKAKVWIEAWKQLSEEGDRIREAIEEEFRSLLGVEASIAGSNGR